jgi:outer membrane protein assembly factor BamB
MSSTVFQSRAVKDVDYKISAIDYLDNALFVGDHSGSIYRYQLNTDDIEIINEKANHIIERLTKSKIEIIRCISFLKIILVLSDGTLHILDCNTLKKRWEPILSKTCATFCINEFNETDLFVITKKKEGIIFKFNTKSEKFERAAENQSA